MTCQLQILLVIIVTMLVIIKADESRRNFVSFNADVAPFHKPRPWSFLLDQPFLDKIIDQRDSTIVSARDQSIGQRASHAFSKDHDVFHSSGLPIYHRRPFKQTPFALTRLKGDPLFAKNQESRAQRAIFRDNPLKEQSTSFVPLAEIFRGSTHKTRAPLKQQLFMAETPLRNLFHGQSPSGERVSFQKQASFVVDYLSPPSSDPLKFYREDPYDKPIDSYGRQKDARISPYEKRYTDNDSDMLPSPMWSSVNLFPLNAEVPMTPSVPIAIDESGFSISPVSSGNDEVHSSEALKMKPDPMSTLDAVASVQVDGNCNALVDSSPSVSSSAATTVPSISVSANQSSIVGHILTSLTTKPNSPVMATATPIKPFGNTLEPIYFHATKYGALVTPSVSAESGLKNGIDAYSLTQAASSSIKSNERNIKYLVPEAAKNNAKTDTHSPILSYVVAGEGLKGLQNSLTNNVLPEGLKYDWSLQQEDISSGYAPLSLDAKDSLVLPSVPVVPISAISWPTKSTRAGSVVPPGKSVMVPDVATSDNSLLGIPLDLMGSMPSSLTPSRSNGISGSVTSGISKTIPDGTAADMLASIPTLGLGQGLHRAEQLQRTQEARNLWYPAGLQLQLGGFGGINYTLHTSNPTHVRSTELGIAEAGLTPPKLPWPQAPALAKVSSQGVIASFAVPALAPLKTLRIDDM